MRRRVMANARKSTMGAACGRLRQVRKPRCQLRAGKEPPDAAAGPVMQRQSVVLGAVSCSSIACVCSTQYMGI